MKERHRFVKPIDMSRNALNRTTYLSLVCIYYVVVVVQSALGQGSGSFYLGPKLGNLQ